MNSWTKQMTLVALALLLAPPALADEGVRHDEGIGFYVGIDGRTTLTGTYSGLPNPNLGRLTLLFDHGDHFHGIGTYSLAGPAPHPNVVPTNSNNRIPEIYTGEAPLSLAPGGGLYDGRYRSMVNDSEYSFLGMASIQSLAGFGAGTPESTLFNSSGGRWNQPLDGVWVGLELLSATPGLHVGTESVLNLFSASNTVLLGAGNSFEFKPVYWVDGLAAAGTYSATFRLVDVMAGSLVGPSGTFSFDFQVTPVPEPGTYGMMLAGLLAMAWVARRRLSA
jgi:hypothetical protein